MAKLKNPLASLRASGGLGNALSYARRKAVNLVMRKPVLMDSESPAQVLWRTMFTACKDLWHTLSVAEKAAFEREGTARHMTGYAWYMSQCLRPNPGIYLPLAGGTMTGTIAMDGHRIEALPAPVAATDAVRKSYADALDRGEGHITLLPLSYNTIVQGTWALAMSASQYLCATFLNSTHANGDSLTWKAYLQPGTYTLMLLHFTGLSRGIVDFDIDAVEVASFDTYAGSSNANIRSTQAGIVIATKGLKTITLRLDGKNPLSDDYYCNFNYLALWRTA